MEFGRIIEYNNRWYLVNNWLMLEAYAVQVHIIGMLFYEYISVLTV